MLVRKEVEESVRIFNKGTLNKNCLKLLCADIINNRVPAPAQISPLWCKLQIGSTSNKQNVFYSPLTTYLDIIEQVTCKFASFYNAFFERNSTKNQYLSEIFSLY